MSPRVFLRRHGSFSTRNNKFRISKTPGKNNKNIILKKTSSYIICGDKKTKLNGIKRPNFMGLMNLSKKHKKVSRVYGGVLSGNAVRERIIKAFLVEEQKIGKKVLHNQKKKK